MGVNIAIECSNLQLGGGIRGWPFFIYICLCFCTCVEDVVRRLLSLEIKFEIESQFAKCTTAHGEHVHAPRRFSFSLLCRVVE